MRISGIACLLTLWAAGAVRAADAGVFPVVGTNLSAGEAAAIGQLVASAYASQSGQPVFGPEDLRPSLERTRSERDSAREFGLAQYVHVDAVRLTTRIALYVRLRDAGGATLFELHDTAYSLDDMPVLCERIAAALLRRTSLETTRGIDDVTEREAHARNRLFVEKIFGARFGVVLPFAEHLERQASLLVQFDARLEQPDYFLELSAGFWLPSETNSRESMSGFVAQLGGSYYLTHTSVSPYLGVGVSPRVFLGDYTGAGLAVNAHVGVMFLREASTRLYAELRVDQNLLKARPSHPAFEDSLERFHTARDVLPTEGTFAVGLGF